MCAAAPRFHRRRGPLFLCLATLVGHGAGRNTPPSRWLNGIIKVGLWRWMNTNDVTFFYLFSFFSSLKKKRKKNWRGGADPILGQRGVRAGICGIGIKRHQLSLWSHSADMACAIHLQIFNEAHVRGGPSFFFFVGSVESCRTAVRERSRRIYLP